jgi:hypothetical protein
MVSLDRGANKWKASLVSLALFIGVRGRDIYGEVGKLDALGDYSDVSWGCTDPDNKVLVLLLRPASERVDGAEDRCFNSRVCEIVHRPVRIFDDVMEDRGAQLGYRRVGAKSLRNVKRVSQIELVRRVSAMMFEGSRGERYRVNKHVRSRAGRIHPVRIPVARALQSLALATSPLERS